MTSSDDGWIDMTDLDAELDRLLSGAAPPADAPAWCGDVAVLVRAARAPARAAELAREAEIVARMRELRLAVLAGEATEDDVPVPGAAPRQPAGPPAPVAATGDTTVDITAGSDLAAAAGVETDPAPGAERAARSDRVPHDPLAERVRARMTSAPVADLDDYRAKHGGERYYRAKHAAARLEASKYPLARTLGRVVAMKAVAVTTAAAIGVGVAAAATTGIVASVVVPAISENVRRPVTTLPPTTTHHSAKDGTAAGSGSGRSGSSGLAGDDCSTSLLPTCVPLPPALVVTVPADVAAQAAATTATTLPASDTTSTTTPPETTTTTSTSTPETTTTVPETTTTVTPTTAPEPGTGGTLSSTGG